MVHGDAKIHERVYEDVQTDTHRRIHVLVAATATKSTAAAVKMRTAAVAAAVLEAAVASSSSNTSSSTTALVLTAFVPLLYWSSGTRDDTYL